MSVFYCIFLPLGKRVWTLLRPWPETIFSLVFTVSFCLIANLLPPSSLSSDTPYQKQFSKIMFVSTVGGPAGPKPFFPRGFPPRRPDGPSKKFVSIQLRWRLFFWIQAFIAKQKKGDDAASTKKGADADLFKRKSEKPGFGQAKHMVRSVCYGNAWSVPWLSNTKDCFELNESIVITVYWRVPTFSLKTHVCWIWENFNYFSWLYLVFFDFLWFLTIPRFSMAFADAHQTLRNAAMHSHSVCRAQTVFTTN